MSGTRAAARRPRAGAPAAALGPVALLGAMWGSAFLFIKLALRSFDPWEVSFARLAIGALVLFALAATLPGEREQPRPRGRVTWLLLATFALVGTVIPFMLITWSVTRLPTTAAAITNATTPLFTAALAVALRREPRPGRLRATGIALGFAGVALMFGLGFSGGSPLARVALLGATLAYAIGFVIATSARFRACSLTLLAASQLAIAATLLAVPALATAASEPPRLALGPVAALVALGAVPTGLASFVQLRAVRRVGAASASLATYVVPVVGTALGFAFLGESVGPLVVLGALVTAAGIVLAERGRAPS